MTETAKSGDSPSKLEFLALVFRRWLEEPIGIFYALLIFIVFRIPEQIPDMLTRVSLRDGPQDDWPALLIYLIAALSLAGSIWFWTFAVNGAEALIAGGRGMHGIGKLIRQFGCSPYMTAAFAAGMIALLASIAALFGPIFGHENFVELPSFLNPVVAELLILIILSLLGGWFLARSWERQPDDPDDDTWRCRYPGLRDDDRQLHWRCAGIFAAAPMGPFWAAIVIILSVVFGFLILSPEDAPILDWLLLAAVLTSVNLLGTHFIFDESAMRLGWRHENSAISALYIIFFGIAIYITVHANNLTAYQFIPILVIYLIFFGLYVCCVFFKSNWAQHIRWAAFTYSVVASAAIVYVAYRFQEGKTPEGETLEKIRTSAPFALLAMAASVGPLVLVLSALRDVAERFLQRLQYHWIQFRQTCYQLGFWKRPAPAFVPLTQRADGGSRAHISRRIGRIVALALFVLLFVLSPFGLTNTLCGTNHERTCRLYTLRFSDGALKHPRPTLQEALRDWASKRKLIPRDSNEAVAGELPEVPVVIIAAEGGASRAAAWMLSVIYHIQQRAGVHPDCKADMFTCHLFAISAVSGGALGAVTYLEYEKSSLADGKRDFPKPLPPNGVSAIASADLLAPSISRFFLTDVMRRTGLLWPIENWWGRLIDDRNVALEKEFEHHWRTAWKIPADLAGMGLLKLHASNNSTWPATHLFLNGVDVETGRRVVTSTVELPADLNGVQDFFADARQFPDKDKAPRDIPASTAVMNSARFPIISPPGVYYSSRGKLRQIIDGGYFEYYGIETALELIDAIKHEARGLNFKPLPILILISNDAEYPDPKIHCQGAAGEQNTKQETIGRRTVTCSSLLNGLKPVTDEYRALPEGLTPLAGLYRVRDAQAQEALSEAYTRLCTPPRFFHMALPKPTCTDHSAPMNWVLHAKVKTFLVDVAPKNGFNDEQIGNFISALRAKVELSRKSIASNETSR